MVQGGDPTATGMGYESIYGGPLKMNFQEKRLSTEHFQWQMQDQIQMVLNSSLFK